MLVAQISDPHLCPAGRLYAGLIDSNALFAAALRHLAALDPFLEPPGSLLHRWTPDTGMVTHRVPVGPFPGPLPIA